MKRRNNITQDMYTDAQLVYGHTTKHAIKSSCPFCLHVNVVDLMQKHNVHKSRKCECCKARYYPVISLETRLRDVQTRTILAEMQQQYELR